MRKCAQFNVKAAGPDDGLSEGQFTGYASVFDVKDSYGDVVVKGAFTDTLAEWNASDNVLPLLWGHQMSDPDYNVGSVLEASEDDHGLLIKAEIDMESPKAAQVYRLIKGRRTSQMSFAYDIEEAGWIETEDDGEYYELRKLKLFEVSVVQIGANQETELLAVKAAAEHADRWATEVKAGRVLSAKNEDTLREAKASLDAAAKQITDVLSAVEGEEAGNDGKAKSGEPESAGDGPDDPMRPAPSDLSALLSIELADAG